jgi:amino acid permease
MKLNSQIKPSKPVSLIGAILGFFFVIFGIVFLITISQEPSFDDGGQIISLFFVLFIVAALTITIFYAKNFFSKKGVSVLDVDFNVDSEMEKDQPKETSDVESRLRQLDKLKSEGLLHDDEYEQKRKAILKEL